MVFVENDEANIGHLHSLFFVFTADKTFFINFFDSAIKPSMQIPLLGA